MLKNHRNNLVELSRWDLSNRNVLCQLLNTKKTTLGTAFGEKLETDFKEFKFKFAFVHKWRPLVFFEARPC